MRKLLLLAAIGGSLGAAAQCTPDALYQDSLYGVWPDTVENFVNGVQNVFYSDTLNLIVPQDAGLIDAQYAGIMLDSVTFDSVSGMPPGLSVLCNSQTGAFCTYLTGQLGCGLIEGIPTASGTFPLTLHVTAYTAFFGSPIPVPQSFAGYSITILPGGVGIAEVGAAGLTGVQNVPNPFNGRTNIEFTLTRGTPVELKVFNLLGERLWNEVSEGHTGLNKVVFDGSTLEDGIYLYKVETGSQTFTGRMVMHR